MHILDESQSIQSNKNLVPAIEKVLFSSYFEDETKTAAASILLDSNSDLRNHLKANDIHSRQFIFKSCSKFLS